MPNDPGMLTELLRVFISAFTAGMARTIPDALDLLRWIAAIEIALLGVRYMMTREVEVFSMAMIVMAVAIFTWIITKWPGLVAGVINSFIGTGLVIGGEAISVTDFTDPSMLIEYGFSVTAVIFKHIKDMAGPQAMLNLPEVLLSGWVASITVFFYMVAGTWVFVILLGFYACAAVSVVLLPFALLRVAAFIAEKPIGLLIAMAIQAMGVATVVGLMLPILVRYQPGLDPTMRNAFMMLLSSLVLLFMCLGAGAIGLAITLGTPQFSFQGVTSFMSNTMTSMGNITSMAAGARGAAGGGGAGSSSNGATRAPVATGGRP